MSAKVYQGEGPDPDSHRSSTQLNDSGFRTVRIFMRKPIDPEPQRSRSRGRKSRATNSGNEFAGFYSPTHSQNIQKSRVDLNKVFSRTPLSPPPQLPPETPTKTYLLTTPPNPSRLLTSNFQTETAQRTQTQASDLTQSQRYESAAIELMQGRIETLEACMSSLTTENKRLRDQIEKVIKINELACNEAEENGRRFMEAEAKVMAKELELIEIAKENQELRRRVQDLQMQNQTLVSTNNSRLEITDYLQSSLEFLKEKLDGESKRREQLENLISGCEDTIRRLETANKASSQQLYNRQKSIQQLTSLLSLEQSKNTTLLAARDSFCQQLQTERQKNKYLGVELSVIKHKKHVRDTSNEKQKGRLLQHNKKLRVQTMKLRLTQRQLRNEQLKNQLFELSPQGRN